MQPDNVNLVFSNNHHEFSIVRLCIFMLCCLTAMSILSLFFAVGLQFIVKKILEKTQRNESKVNPANSGDRPGFFKNTYFVESPEFSARSA